MPQPVSYNPGIPVSGSIQENSISYVVDGQNRNYRGGFGGLSWMSEVPAENNVIFIGNSTSLGRGPANIPLFYPAYNNSSANIVYAANTLPGSPRNFTTTGSAYNWAVTNNFFINNSNNPIPRIDADGLVLYVDANQPTSYPQIGTSWYDLSGFGNNGTLTNGPTWNSNGWFTFDGVDDYVNCGIPITFTTSFSLNFYFKTTTNGVLLIFGMYNGSGADWWIGTLVNGTLNFSFGSPSKSDIATSTVVTDGLWRMATCIYDKNINSIFLYLNGSLQNSSNTIPSTVIQPGGNMTIGRFGDLSAFYWPGSMFNSQLYSRALSQAEIKQNYFQSNIVQDGLVFMVDANNLVSYPKSGTAWYNLTGSVASGSLINGPTFSPSNGGTIVFDGVDDYVQLNGTVSLNVWTITTNLFYNYQNKTFEFFLGNLASGAEGKILLSYAGQVSFRNSSYYNFSKNSSELSNKFSNLSFVSNGTSISLYVDGVFNSSVTPPSTNIPLNTIGNAWSDLVWLPSFKLGDLCMYDRALTPSEIQQNYQATKDKFQGQQIVTNGLIVNLDAANKDSYPGTGTTWYDLSGNGYNGTKQGTQSPTYPLWNTTGYFIFSGGTLGTNFSSFYVPGLPAFSGLSVFAWVRTSDGSESKTILRMQNSDFELSMNGSTQLFYAAGANYDNINTTYNLNFADGNWHYMGLTYDGNNLKAYWEASNVSNNTRGSVVNTEAGDLNIGTRNDAYYQHFIGDVAVVQIYNRTLSATEITQNYNAQKTRFGL